MEIGVFDHLDRNGSSLHDLYEERLRIAEAYDRAGFYSYHVAEHHATPLGSAPSPSVYLSAVAQRTKRLRFGPLVYLLPLYHPLRLAEEIAMLDHLSDGRFDVGVGRGISPIESMLYGADPERSQERFDEALEVLQIAFAREQIDYDGKHFRFHNVPVILKPRQSPHPPFWYGISAPESASRCVARGFNCLTLSATDRAAAIVRSFNEAAVQAGRTDLRIGIVRFIVVGETDEQARRIARRAYRVWHRSFHHLYHAYGRSPVQGERPSEFDGMVELGIGIAGSPSEVIAALGAQIRATGANYVAGQFVFGDMSLAESLASIELFASEVMPAFSAKQVTAP